MMAAWHLEFVRDSTLNRCPERCSHSQQSRAPVGMSDGDSSLFGRTGFLQEIDTPASVSEMVEFSRHVSGRLTSGSTPARRVLIVNQATLRGTISYERKISLRTSCCRLSALALL